MLHVLLGYDVWLGNTRGNTWSKNHTEFEACSSCPKFWDFSWDKTGIYDYTAEIDYILENTGFKDLFVVGFSMGTTQYFSMLAERPEYNDKIKVS